DDDIIRIGSFDIVYLVAEPMTPLKKSGTSSGLSLKREKSAEQPLDFDDLHDELDQIERRRQSGASDSGPKQGSKFVNSGGLRNRDSEDDFDASPPTSELTMAELIEEATADEFPEAAEDDFDSRDRSSSDEAEPEEGSPVTSLRTMFSKNERLKEQTVMRSPMVLALGGGGGLLAIVALVFWFLIEREQVQRQFAAAETEIKQAQFATGITKFDEFIKTHPNHALTEGPKGARVLVGKARIEKELVGAPAFANALKALQDFITEHREAKYFPDLNEDLVVLAKKIALDAPKAAAINKQRDLLKISTDAEEIMVRYSPIDSPPTEAKKEIAKAREDAESAIVKAGEIDKAHASINDSLKKESPFDAVATRQKLVVRYRDLESDPRLNTALRRALELAKKQSVREEFQRDAQTDDPAKLLPKPLSLTVRTRALSDEQSANRVVFALGQDSCFAVDSITGDTLWRRTVGIGTPFFPVPVETSRSGVLLFDTTQNQLMLLDRRTGELAWRQVIEPAAGPPLVVEGQIYLPTLDGFLYRIDADSGRITSRLKFPQRLFAPPLAMADGQHILVIGDSEFSYTLGLDPLECQLVTQIGHQAGTIEAAPLMMGQHVLLAENDRATSSRLRVLNASKAEQRLADVAESRVEGHIRDDMILRGNRLYVISAGPRLSVFNVSDDQNQRTLAPVAALQIPTSHSGAAHLAAGADDQIWLAVGALRKVQLKTDVLQLDQQAIAVGQSTQPMQMIGRNLYVGRQLPVGQAVHLTQADGESMQSNWKTVVGANILAASPGTDGQLVCVTEGADTFLLSANEINNGGFRVRSEQQLKLPDNTLEPLQAVSLSEGRTAVWTNGPDGKLWVVGPSALPQTEIALDHVLECPPLRFAGGALLPMPGRLKLKSPTGSALCEDFLAPVNTTNDGPARKWKHLIAIDDDTLFVIDSAGKMSKLQFRTGEKKFFQTVSSVDLPQPIDVEPTLHKGRLITADAAGTMRVLDVTAMETRAEVVLGGPASKPIWVVEPLLLAEVSRQKLIAYDAAQPKQPLWTLNLEGVGLVGSPLLIGNAVIAVQQSGDVLRIDAKTGQVEQKLTLGQIATHGPLRVGNLLVVLTADGSLQHVESLVPEMAATAKPEPAKPAAVEKPAEEKPAKEDKKDGSAEKPKAE
ncbi:MAG: PQQ-binding-like beta-propeller repeat protein, partial [Planctomycetaceae bacterium]|nr:PQQ-binding-like beta-propeller repeat protein [Planctomycetaceae bacterium]